VFVFLIRLLLSITLHSEELSKRHFTVVIDMRGITWTCVKPALKVLNESFAESVYAALVLEPDSFWQKQRTSFGSQKYKFEIIMIHSGDLANYIQSSHLPVEFGGSSSYEHQQWIEVQVVRGGNNHWWTFGRFPTVSVFCLNFLGLEAKLVIETF
jgi:hypothetical protein